MKRSGTGIVRSQSWSLTLAFVVGIVLVTACSGRPPLTRYYLLEPLTAPATEVGGVAGPGAGRTAKIGVRTFHVDPPYDQDRIVYRVGVASPEVGFYEYHRWAAPLHRMLPVVVAAALAEGSPQMGAEPVIPGVVYDAYLSGRLVRAEEIDLPTGQRVAIHLQLTLHDSDGTELWSAGVEGESTVETDSVPRIVEEMRRILDQALRDTAPAVAAAIQREP